MNNKTIPPYYLIIFILIIVIIGYFLFYQEEKTTEETTPEIGQPTVSTVSDEECGMLTNVIIDGVFQKVENGFLYLEPKDEELTGVVELTEETKFSEMAFSETEVTGEKGIELADLKEGDQISVIAFYDIIKPEKKTALAVRRMVVK